MSIEELKRESEEAKLKVKSFETEEREITCRLRWLDYTLHEVRKQDDSDYRRLWEAKIASEIKMWTNELNLVRSCLINSRLQATIPSCVIDDLYNEGEVENNQSVKDAIDGTSK